MTWNYRIIKYPKTKNNPETYFQIHEVYYKDGKIISYTRDGIKPFGTTKDEILSDMQLMQKAADAPVLTINKLDEEIKKNSEKITRGKK
jgi:hypothetical protein